MQSKLTVFVALAIFAATAIACEPRSTNDKCRDDNDCPTDLYCEQNGCVGEPDPSE